MQRPLVVPRSPPPAVTSRRTLMGLIGSGMCLSDVTCPQPPAEHPLSRITRAAVLLSLVRAPALPPRHAYFGSQSHTPYDRCLRFGPRVAATPARLAPVLLAQLWTDQTCTGKLISASPIAPRNMAPHATRLYNHIDASSRTRAGERRRSSVREGSVFPEKPVPFALPGLAFGRSRVWQPRRPVRPTIAPPCPSTTSSGRRHRHRICAR